MTDTKGIKQNVYTVSGLTREIKDLLENTYPFVWIAGEISNLATPSSGHSYFTLKDDAAVISCVLFKNQGSRLKFSLENGLNIIGIARISLYAPRGSYQLIFEHLDPEGAGALQVAFEQLKIKLETEGLFDKIHKKPLPFLPDKINVITSRTGAAVRDIINVVQRRFPGIHLEVIPVCVQGKDAVPEICRAIALANEQNRSQVIILARGGGSIEDLSAFNSEEVARAVFNSEIPIISGIGHETDFTITDFVSDLRAPTPSAAAELAVPDVNSLLQRIEQLRLTLNHRLQSKISSLRDLLKIFESRLISPQRHIDDARFKIEDSESRMHMVFSHLLDHKKLLVSQLQSRLNALSPFAVLKRGYSITRHLPHHHIVMDSSTVRHDDMLEIILSQGSLSAKVIKEND